MTPSNWYSLFWKWPDSCHNVKGGAVASKLLVLKLSRTRRSNALVLAVAALLWLGTPPPAFSKTFLLDPGSYRLGDGMASQSGYRATVAYPTYSISFHLVHPTRLRVILKKVRIIDSPVSLVRLMGGVMTFGAGFTRLDGFGAEVRVARLVNKRPGEVLFRAPIAVPRNGGLYRSSWTEKLPRGDYVLSLGANFHGILEEFDDFIFTELSTEVEEPLAKVALLYPGQVNSVNERKNVLPPFHEVVKTKRPGNQSYLVMDLVEERTRNLELQLEVQRLRESLDRAGIGIVPVPNEAPFPAPSR